jgi:hypothetical protein
MNAKGERSWLRFFGLFFFSSPRRAALQDSSPTAKLLTKTGESCKPYLVELKTEMIMIDLKKLSERAANALSAQELVIVRRYLSLVRKMRRNEEVLAALAEKTKTELTRSRELAQQMKELEEGAANGTVAAEEESESDSARA